MFLAGRGARGPSSSLEVSVVAASSCWTWDENWNCIKFISPPTSRKSPVMSAPERQLTRTLGQSLTAAFLAIYAQAAPGV